MLISNEMAQRNYMNNTIIPVLESRSGASAESAGQFEEDTVQDHLHLDPGLKLLIMGIHIMIMDMYIMRLSLRTTYFLGVHDKDKKDLLCSRYLNRADTGCAGWYFNPLTGLGRADISYNKASIQTSTIQGSVEWHLVELEMKQDLLKTMEIISSHYFIIKKQNRAVSGSSAAKRIG